MTVSSWNLAEDGCRLHIIDQTRNSEKEKISSFFSKWWKQMSRSSAPSAHSQTISLWLCFFPLEWALETSPGEEKNKSIKCGQSELWWLTSFPFISSHSLSPSAMHLPTSSISLSLLRTYVRIFIVLFLTFLTFPSEFTQVSVSEAAQLTCPLCSSLVCTV